MRKLDRKQMARVMRLHRQEGFSANDLAKRFGLHPATMCRYIRQWEKGVVEEWGGHRCSL